MIITLLRKPLDGSVAENALQHGCGGINIDATRVGTRVGTEGGTKRSEQTPYPKKLDGTEDRSGSWARTGHSSVDICGGRWPANFILTHLDGCELRGMKTIKENTANGVSNTTIGDGKTYGGGSPRKITHHADENGEAQIADWACVDGCPVQEMDIQSGHLKSTTRKPTGNPIYPTSNTSVKWNANNVIDTTQRGFNDDGGASRFFMQFQKDN